MQKVAQFLAEAGTFFFATVEDGKPRVRPFGFCMVFEDKLYFCMNETKEVYKQLTANPSFELTATKQDMTWLRLSGEAVFDRRPEARAKAFEVAPYLQGMYGNPDSPPFALCYVKNGHGAFFSMAAAPEVFKL